MVTYILFNFILIVLSVIFVLGLIKPRLIIRWKKKPNRKEFFIYWLVGFFSVLVLYLFIGDADYDKLKKSQSLIEKGNYTNAKSRLEDIDKESKHFSDAQILLEKIDSLLIIEIKPKITQGNYTNAKSRLEDIDKESKHFSDAQILLEKIDSLKQIDEEQALNIQREKLKRQIEDEIASLNEGLDFSSYRGTVQALQLEIALFQTWSSLVKKGKASNDNEIVGMAKTLESKVRNIQVREFPKLRGEYAKKASKEMWEFDIDVFASGSGNRYINFTGGIFAANKNKKDYQNKLHETLKEFRFRQSRYRWYEGDSEYTYYTVFEGHDSDMYN